MGLHEDIVESGRMRVHVFEVMISCEEGSGKGR